MPSERNGSATNDFGPSRALLVGVELRGAQALFSADDSLDELALLASTAGVQVVGRAVQRVGRIDPATFIGSGKLAEIAETLAETGANMIIFDDELSPRHQRELEKALGEHVQVLDRSALILDIFAQHARTREGALQVELAQYEYRLPRLTRQWTHLARQAGGGAARGGAGGVGLRGPGETQLEVDRREIGRRIARLRDELESVRAHRQRHRQQRMRSGIPTVALVGYTNAGKSTLLNALSGADVYVADQLFATLDPTVRRVDLPNGRVVLVSDTVGFIQKLPVTLVAAFRATLEEVADADLLVHVVDASHQRAWDQIDVVEDTLAELEATRIPKILVLNKIDRGECCGPLDYAALGYLDMVRVSARQGAGLDALREAISHALMANLVTIEIIIPYAQGEWISAIHDRGIVLDERHSEQGVTIAAHVPHWLAGRMRQGGVLQNQGDDAQP
ncbi:MAG: GTPase HflX [Anaerolineae bacterium]|nr:GTPase HflX [Anaerolineae bacterium]